MARRGRGVGLWAGGRVTVAAVVVLWMAGGYAGAAGQVAPPCGVPQHADRAAASIPDSTASTWLFPARDLLPDLLAGPRDPAIRGQLVYGRDDPTRYGPGVSGEVALGATLPVVLLAGAPSRNALVVGLEGAVFARFSFEVVERELVNTDWAFAVPLVWRRGEHWLRLRYHHTSSHLGDEYARRFDEKGVNFSRDAVDLTAYARPVRAAATYGLLQWAANVHPEASKRWLARAGAELDPSRGGLWRPYAAVDVQVEEDTGWEPRVTAQAGIWLPSIHGRPFRAALEGITGPSPMGQFHGRLTRQLSVALIWNP